MHPVRQSPTSYDGATRPAPAVKEQKQLVPQAGKVHFCAQKCTLPAFYVLQQALLESCFGLKWVTFWTLLAVYGSKKP